MLERFTESIWTESQPFRFYGVPCGARMTVVRLGTGDLWVHSPLGICPDVAQEMDGLGAVHYIVAPSRLHYLCVNEFRSRYPAALVFGSPKLVERCRDISFTGTLKDEPESGWAAEIDQAVMPGNGFLDEVVFLHRKSRTLIVADLLMSAHADSAWQMRLVGRLGGIYERPGPPIDMKLIGWDRTRARPVVERILRWDFDRIILSHGHLINGGGREAFRRAYAFLLDP